MSIVNSTSEVGGKQVDRGHLARLTHDELEVFNERTAKSRELFYEARRHLLGGVPMSWMNKWAGGYPIYLDKAHGSTLVDIDGNSYIDFCLGDTGAMAGHSPVATVEAIKRRIELDGGFTTMLPSSDSIDVARQLAERFNLPYWQYTLTATDANRFVLRLCRQITHRKKILVFSYCYHGTVDETFITLKGGEPHSREGNVGPAIDPTYTTEVVEFNDIEALREHLSKGDVACILTEPALTNIGIVLPKEGFLEEMVRLAHENGTYVIFDETHTFSASWGGATSFFNVQPDIVTIGKSVAGGYPFGAFGVSDTIANAISRESEIDLIDTGGIGGTLAGNVLSMAAANATLSEVFTKANFKRMVDLSAKFAAGVEAVLEKYEVPWHIVTLGARSEYRFSAKIPENGGESASYADGELDLYMHLAMSNRSILMTPFHNMALISPSTSIADVDRHSEVFEEVVSKLRFE